MKLYNQYPFLQVCNQGCMYVSQDSTNVPCMSTGAILVEQECLESGKVLNIFNPGPQGHSPHSQLSRLFIFHQRSHSSS